MALQQYLGFIQQNKYLYSLSILVAFYLLSQLVLVVSQKIILQLTKKTKTTIDDLIIRKTSKPISLILLFIGIRLAFLPLQIKANILDILENIISSIIIVIIIYIAIAVFDILIDNWGRKVAEKTKSTFDDRVIPIFHRFSRVFISIIGLLFILPVWGIQIGPLLASLGIVGIAIAFALQNTLGNIFGGMSITLDKSIKVGDAIKVDDTMGTVTDVGLRSTKIRTVDNEIITIPNGKLADSKILNFLQPDPRSRIVIEFSVEYGSDISKVRKTVIDALLKIQGVLKEPQPRVILKDMGEFALNLRASFWIAAFDINYELKALATEEIYNSLSKAGIRIPFPTRTVYLKKEE